MSNATMAAFGWPETRIAELDHWVVALRPQQPTLGSLVVICKEPVQAFGEVSPEGFAEFACQREWLYALAPGVQLTNDDQPVAEVVRNPGELADEANVPERPWSKSWSNLRRGL